jgi:hypothetical protein
MYRYTDRESKRSFDQPSGHFTTLHKQSQLNRLTPDPRMISQTAHCRNTIGEKTQVWRLQCDLLDGIGYRK